MGMTGQTSWADAQSRCTAAGYTGLAVITSTAQQTAVEGLVKGVEQAYIGLGDEATEGTFLWVDGSNTNSYENWLNNPPEANKNQNCVKMRKGDGKWTPVACNKKSADN